MSSILSEIIALYGFILHIYYSGKCISAIQEISRGKGEIIPPENGTAPLSYKFAHLHLVNGLTQQSVKILSPSIFEHLNFPSELIS